MIVFDAGVLIAHVQRSDVFHKPVQHFLEENEEFDFAATTLTVAECLVHATETGRVTTALGIFERLMLLQFDITSADAAGIAEVRARTGLRMPDALVLYTAERRGAELVTTDRALARAAERRGVEATLLTAA